MDAIVSNKTFRNATFPPRWKLLQSWFQQIVLFLQIIQIISRHAALHFLVCRRGNGILPSGRSNCPSLRRVLPVALWPDSFLMSRCTTALNGQINSCGRGAWEMRGHGILEEPSAAPFCSGAHPLSGNPDAVLAGQRRCGVGEPSGNPTRNVHADGPNPSHPPHLPSYSPPP